MKVFHENLHPNGFKICLALKYSKLKEEGYTVSNEVRNGAQLEISHDGLNYKLDPNSAVSYLISGDQNYTEISKIVQEWLDWDAASKEYLHSYLSSIVNSKNDVTLPEGLSTQLSFLNGALSLTPNYILGKLTEADIILYVSLLPLLTEKKASKVLTSFSKIEGYLKFLRAIKEFQEAEEFYYGKNGISLSWLSSPSANIFSKKNDTYDLLKKVNETPAPNPSSVPQEEEKRVVSPTELKNAEQEWNRDMSKVSPKERVEPALPVVGETNTLITSALPYVNNVPHLGNIIGCVLSADCFARFCRTKGDNVLYICGTDEYGTATETKAIEDGVTPQQLCDKYHKIHADVYKWFNISFDNFGRTATSDLTEVCQSIFWDLDADGKISKNEVDQLFCNTCQRFLADRFVEGTCPNVGCVYEDARGDQCDGCGKLVNAVELINPRCKFCSNAPAIRQMSHLFLDLPKLEEEHLVWFKKSSPNWSSNARIICESWLKEGLRERCITRDLKWGTPVPMEGYTDKVFYVWFDACIAYISMTKTYMDEWRQWWFNPENVSYYEFMAKDNVPFHGVIFPSSLLGTKKNWTMVTHLFATEYLNYEDGKFSKSRGVGVFGDHARETGISSDVWRFYLLYLRPENHDTAFSWVDLQSKNNNELLNNIGNFVNRSLKFVYQNYKGVLPPVSPTKADFTLMASVNQEIEKFVNVLSKGRLRDGIRVILSIARLGNQYIQENEPYKLVKADRPDSDKERAGTVINISVNMVGLVGVLLQPYMPDTSGVILDLLNNPRCLGLLPSALSQYMLPGHTIKEPYPLIRKITDEEIESFQKKFAGGDDSKKPTKKTTRENTPVSSEETKRLEAAITEQGNKVRALKEAKAHKGVIAPEVTILLGLKKELQVAQGLAPAADGKSQKSKGTKGSEPTVEKLEKLVIE